jgi:hypothetical protein
VLLVGCVQYIMIFQNKFQTHNVDEMSISRTEMVENSVKAKFMPTLPFGILHLYLYLYSIRIWK